VTASTYVWRRLDLDGLDFVRLDARADEVSAEGHEICADGAERWGLHFVAVLDREWRHRRTTIAAVDLAGTRTVELTSDAAGAWARNGSLDPSLDGCTDVDIAGNPFTNAFVTRRVAPEVGTETEVRAAFVEPPELSVRPLVQRYRRLEPDRWQYADNDYGAFEFTTDADGVAVHYERLAERIR
jgi:uncharacterized protein